MNNTVTLLVRAKDADLYLGVTRPYTSDQWGLPGGKVEPGETLTDAIIREMREETGYAISNPIQVFSGIVPGEVTYRNTTFMAVADYSNPPRTEEPIMVAWVSRKTLEAGPFGEYIKALFEHLEEASKCVRTCK